MSGAYRYVVFAAGKQPTIEEVAQLRNWAATTQQRYAVGISGDDARLALGFEAAGFDMACSSDGPFATLLSRWKVRGCEVREKLPFIKKPTALQPIPGGLLHELVERRSEPALKSKQLAAQEALGRAGLRFQQTLQQHEWLARIAKGVPYALMALGAVLTIAAGTYFANRLLDSPTERRKETIHRVASDAMQESLQRKSLEAEPQGSPQTREPQPEGMD